METSISTHQKNIGTFIHLSTFCKYLFPFGNFIGPLVLWSAQKRNSAFIDEHGRGAINFQLSILLYLIVVAIISIPFFIYQVFLFESSDIQRTFNGHIDHVSDLTQLSGFIITAIIVGVIAIGLFLIELISVISAAIKASNGEIYKYPLTINFIKQSEIAEEPQLNDNDVEDLSNSTKE